MKGRGDALPLPAAFPLSPLGIETYLIASDGVTTKCWGRGLVPAIQTETQFKLRYRR